MLQEYPSMCMYNIIDEAVEHRNKTVGYIYETAEKLQHVLVGRLCISRSAKRLNFPVIVYVKRVFRACALG